MRLCVSGSTQAAPLMSRRKTRSASAAAGGALGAGVANASGAMSIMGLTDDHDGVLALSNLLAMQEGATVFNALDNEVTAMSKLSPIYGVILDKGTWFYNNGKSRTDKHFESFQCFRAVRQTCYTGEGKAWYGFAVCLGGLPLTVDHAWRVDDGKVVEYVSAFHWPTIYVGIHVPDDVVRIISEAETSGEQNVLEAWRFMQDKDDLLTRIHEANSDGEGMGVEVEVVEVEEVEEEDAAVGFGAAYFRVTEEGTAVKWGTCPLPYRHEVREWADTAAVEDLFRDPEDAGRIQRWKFEAGGHTYSGVDIDTLWVQLTPLLHTPRDGAGDNKLSIAIDLRQE